MNKIILILILAVVGISGCTLNAAPKCPVCNTSDYVVSHVDNYNTTDFECKKCGSTHYLNNTLTNYPEAGWDIGFYKVLSTGGNLSSNEVVFIGDSGKNYTSADLTASRQNKKSNFNSIYIVQHYKDPQGFTVVNNVNADKKYRQTQWSNKQINDEYYEVTCTLIPGSGTGNKTAKWKVNTATGKITALNKNAEAYMT